MRTAFLNFRSKGTPTNQLRIPLNSPQILLAPVRIPLREK